MQTQKKEAAEASTDPERMLSLRMWGDAAKDVLHEAFVDCGWGRLIFGQTFAAPASLAEVPEAYVLQLALYRALLRPLYPGREVSAALLFTEAPRLVALPAAAMDEALARLSAS